MVQVTGTVTFEAPACQCGGGGGGSSKPDVYIDNTYGYDSLPVGGIGGETWRSVYAVFVPNIVAGDVVHVLGEAQLRNNDPGANVELAQLLTWVDADNIDSEGANNGWNDSSYATLNGVQYHNWLPSNMAVQSNMHIMYFKKTMRMVFGFILGCVRIRQEQAQA